MKVRELCFREESLKVLMNFVKLIFCLFGVCLFLAGCEKLSSPTPNQKPTILVSIAPYSYFVERIAGDTLSIQVLVPAASNPHIFEPTLSQVERASHAKIWFKSGDPFEKKILQVFKEQNPSFISIDMCEGIPLLAAEEAPAHENHSFSHSAHSHDEDRDLHIWLSPRLAKKQAQTIANALCDQFPEQRALYMQRLNDFLVDLDLLDHTIAELLAPLNERAILVSHPAFGYFCQDYSLSQLSIEVEGKDPLPQSLTQILKLAQERQVKSVLTQAQYNNKGAEVIAKQLNLPVFMVDPYSSDYIKNLMDLARLIAHSSTHVEALP